MASPSDLVTLAVVKSWLTVPAVSADDGALGTLISQVSVKIINQINRNSILPRNFTEVLDGHGKHSILLRNYPVASIASLTVDGRSIPAGSFQSNGYLLEAPDDMPPGKRQTLQLRGSSFNRGQQNISVTYPAGYRVTDEPAVAAAQVTAQQPFGAWASDLGVKNASTGAALVKIAAGTTPTAGQYALAPLTGPGAVAGGYVFATADAGAPMIISYGYIPADLAQAALEWIGERYSYRSRIGQQSRSLGGQETTSFAIGSMPRFIVDMLHQYTCVTQ